MVIDTECELMQAVWLWGEEQCKGRGTIASIENVRKYTKDLMKYIRFTSVATKDWEKLLEKFQFVDTSEALCQFSESEDNKNSNRQSEMSCLSNTRSIANCSRLEIPTKYKYDGNMSTFTNVEHYQKIDVSVSGPDITILGFNIAFKPIPCYSAPDRCLKLEFLINNYSTNAQTRIESSIAAKENNANQIEQEVILDDFIVISEGDICEIVAIVSGEGVRIMHCVEDRFTKNCGSSRLSCSLNASDDALLFPVKEILCKQT
ncbi:uncharacterized protein LOC129224625 isoform X1 [Uloborus diversus]|uniref:uncharacterized protein LOC129224625 isoform X1 n=1 Tax=Uloborus diversus TaxID=327109 RepID=UPI002409CB61|nr:uncharacterized protein LOC129224625 isoform X1 [Uloborus diversus]